MKRNLFIISIAIILAIGLWGAHPTQRALAAACTWTGSTSTAWATAGNWTDCGGLAPQTGDSVTIPNGPLNYPEITSSVTVMSVQINPGAILTVGTLGSLSVATITISSTGLLTVISDGSVNISGNLVCDGIYSASGRRTTFSGAVSQTVSGAGTTTFGIITINNTGAPGDNIVEFIPSFFNADAAFLTLTRGIFKLSGNYILSNTLFNSSAYGIVANAGIWLNNPNATILAVAGAPTNKVLLYGSLRISRGTYHVGDVVGGPGFEGGSGLEYESGSSLRIDGGALIIGGWFTGLSGSSSYIDFNMSSGTFMLGTIPTFATGGATFTVYGPSNVITISGGTITVINENPGGQDFTLGNGGLATITGGTVQFGNSATVDAAPTFVYQGSGLPSLVIANNGSGNTPSLDIQSSTGLYIFGDVTIGSSTTLQISLGNITIAGNPTAPGSWINNGTFILPTNVIVFSGHAGQTMGGANTTDYNNLIVGNTNPGGITVNHNFTVHGYFYIFPGSTLNLSTYAVTALGTATNDGLLIQKKPVNNATVEFMHITDGASTPVTKYRGVDITTTNNLGDVTVAIRGNAGTTCTTTGGSSPHYAPRCYYIVPTTDGSATVKLWALTSEIPGDITDPAVFRFTTSWEELLTNRSNGTDSGSYTYVQGDTPGFSSFLFGRHGTGPTVITLKNLTAKNTAKYGLILSSAILMLFALAAISYIARRRHT